MKHCTFTSSARNRLCAAVFIVCMGLAAVPSAWAHARLLKSVPAKQTEVAVAPTQIDLWFNELLDDGFNSLEVYPSSQIGEKKHTDFTAEKPCVDSNDKTHLFAKLKPLSPGEYIVEWRVLSRDGHSAPGRLTFKITSH